MFNLSFYKRSLFIALFLFAGIYGISAHNIEKADLTPISEVQANVMADPCPGGFSSWWEDGAFGLVKCNCETLSGVEPNTGCSSSDPIRD